MPLRAAGQAGDLVGKPLGERYHIIKLLGAGGMGAVYQALDNELGVAVAIKTVRKELAADPETARLLDRRFKQELLLARKVTHKNIVRVHDIGELDGVKYITMPYLQGEDLASVLKREGKLPVERVLTLARSVISGLAAAHDAGVVHRDLKPANIMVAPDGEGLVMDFGVARSTEAALATTEGPISSESLATLPAHGTSRPLEQTASGMVVGTIEYMAPEQSRGEAVDQRADVYAFGLILYDLLLGRTRAARVKSAIAELQNRMREAPPPLREVDPTIPVAVERIVMRCVQPEAADRFATSRELEGEFAKLDAHGVPLPLAKRITWTQATAAGVAMAILLGATYWSARGPAVAVKHEPVSILITDLQNETGEKTFDRALEPMLKLALEGAGFISAYDRNGIRRSLGVVPPEVLDEKAGRALAVQQGVGVVLAGSLARDGSGYTVTLKATESVTGNTIATESDDASGRDGVLAVATDLGNRIRTALGDNTSDSTRRFATEKLSATSLEVVREYALAMQALSSSQFAEARSAFERAIRIDPNFGLAYAGLASDGVQHGAAPGSRAVRQGGDPPRRSDDRARAPANARAAVLRHQRLRSVREGVRRPARPVRGRRRRAQQPRALLDEAAQHGAGARRDDPRGRHPPEALAVSPQRLALLDLRGRLRTARRDAMRSWPSNSATVGRCRPWPWPSWDSTTSAPPLPRTRR